MSAPPRRREPLEWLGLGVLVALAALPLAWWALYRLLQTLGV